MNSIMKTSYFSLFLTLAFYTGLSQVSMQTNIPSSIAPNTELTFEVKISKGDITSFSKYQIDVPTGVSVSEGNSKKGNFTFDDGRAKIVWVSVPAEPEFIVSFKMNTGPASGPAVFNQKFFYIENGAKNEIEADPLNVTFEPGGAIAAKSFGMEETSDNPENKTPSNVPPPNNSSSENNTIASNNTSTVTSGEVNSSAVTNNTPQAENTKTSPASETNTKTAAAITPPPENKPAVANKTPVTENKTPESGRAPSSASGLIYKVQLGAYGFDPGKAKYSAAGKVTISKEGGFYKVLLGSFSTKEEAVQKTKELKTKGFDSFVVKYQNGERVK